MGEYFYETCIAIIVQQDVDDMWGATVMSQASDTYKVLGSLGLAQLMTNRSGIPAPA